MVIDGCFQRQVAAEALGGRPWVGAQDAVPRSDAPRERPGQVSVPASRTRAARSSGSGRNHGSRGSGHAVMLARLARLAVLGGVPPPPKTAIGLTSMNSPGLSMWVASGSSLQPGLFTHGRKQSASWPMAGIDWVRDVPASRLNGQQVK